MSAEEFESNYVAVIVLGNGLRKINLHEHVIKRSREAIRAVMDILKDPEVVSKMDAEEKRLCVEQLHNHGDQLIRMYNESEKEEADTRLNLMTYYDEICTDLRQSYKQTDNPLFLWTLYQIQRLLSKPLSEDILDYLDQCASGLLQITYEYPIEEILTQSKAGSKNAEYLDESCMVALRLRKNKQLPISGAKFLKNYLDSLDDGKKKRRKKQLKAAEPISDKYLHILGLEQKNQPNVFVQYMKYPLKQGIISDLQKEFRRQRSLTKTMKNAKNRTIENIHALYEKNLKQSGIGKSPSKSTIREVFTKEVEPKMEEEL